MNWRWILMLSLLGVAMGVASVMGWMGGKELWLWIGIVLIAAVLLGYNVKTKLFKHGFFTAALWTVLNGLVVMILWDTYIENNPQTAAQFAQIPAGLNPRIFMLISVVFLALIWGAVLGLLAMLAGKLLAEKSEESYPEQKDIET